MGPAKSSAGEFAATAGMHHRQPLHADMPPMHATPMPLVRLTWCCCSEARAAKEWQLMAHAQEQGRAAQVNISVACNEHYCMHAAFSSAGC
jgi:hypothetical protein